MSDKEVLIETNARNEYEERQDEFFNEIMGKMEDTFGFEDIVIITQKDNKVGVHGNSSREKSKAIVKFMANEIL